MPSLPDFADLLGDEIVTVWSTIARIVPAGSILMGGTALAMRLSHRRSEEARHARLARSFQQRLG